MNDFASDPANDPNSDLFDPFGESADDNVFGDQPAIESASAFKLVAISQSTDAKPNVTPLPPLSPECPHPNTSSLCSDPNAGAISWSHTAGPDVDDDPDPFPDETETEPAREAESRRMAIASDPISETATRLRAALGTERGKIRISDAQTLAGIPQPNYFWTCVVGRAMQRLGWHRRRCRLDGKLAYAYAKGTPYERMLTLEVERRDDGEVVVKQYVVRRTLRREVQSARLSMRERVSTSQPIDSARVQ